MPEATIRLARWARMIGIEAPKGKLQSIGKMKLKGIMRLRFVIHTDNFKACPMVAHCRPAGTTEQV